MDGSGSCSPWRCSSPQAAALANPLKLRAEAGGFLEELCEWSQLIIIVELSTVGEHPQIHEKKVLH